MLLAKLPPPSPAVAAATRKKAYGVAGLLTHATSSASGRSSSSALTTVQLRPPNLATANV